MADLTTIRAAAASLRGGDWIHGPDCPHRDCNNPADCGTGWIARPFDDCKADPRDGSPFHPACDCYVSDIARLLAAIDAPPAPHPFAALLRDDAALVAVSRGLGPMTHAERVRALLRLGAESDLYEGTPQPGHREGCALAGWPYDVSPCGCGAEAPRVDDGLEPYRCPSCNRPRDDAAGWCGNGGHTRAADPEAGKDGAGDAEA